MLDDLLELGLDLAGEGVEAMLSGSKTRKRGRTKPAQRTSQPLNQPEAPAGKVTAQRKKRGEDPWEWKEKKPPWEG